LRLVNAAAIIPATVMGEWRRKLRWFVAMCDVQALDRTIAAYRRCYLDGVVGALESLRERDGGKVVVSAHGFQSAIRSAQVALEYARTEAGYVPMTYNTLGEDVAALLNCLTVTHRASSQSRLPFMATRSAAIAARACREAAWHEWCVGFWMDRDDSLDFAFDMDGKPFNPGLRWYDVDASGKVNRRKKTWTPEMALWETDDWARAIVDADRRRTAVDSQRPARPEPPPHPTGYTDAGTVADVKAIAAEWDAAREQVKKNWEEYERQIEEFRAANSEASLAYWRSFDDAEGHVRESQREEQRGWLRKAFGFEPTGRQRRAIARILGASP
jgi:hypothetical protein